MNNLPPSFLDRFWRRDKAALRFNNAFQDGIEQFREQLGIINADHAARGLLRSGATIKRGLSAYETSFEGALEICFAYITAQTDHHGWKRRKHVALLDALLTEYAERYNKVFVENCLKVSGNRGAAADAAESIRRKADEALHDKIQRYSEGIGQAKPDRWVSRHPIAAAALISAVSLIVGYALGLIGIK